MTSKKEKNPIRFELSYRNNRVKIRTIFFFLTGKKKESTTKTKEKIEAPWCREVLISIILYNISREREELSITTLLLSHFFYQPFVSQNLVQNFQNFTFNWKSLTPAKTGISKNLPGKLHYFSAKTIDRKSIPNTVLRNSMKYTWLRKAQRGTYDAVENQAAVHLLTSPRIIIIDANDVFVNIQC